MKNPFQLKRHIKESKYLWLLLVPSVIGIICFFLYEAYIMPNVLPILLQSTISNQEWQTFLLYSYYEELALLVPALFFITMVGIFFVYKNQFKLQTMIIYLVVNVLISLFFLSFAANYLPYHNVLRQILYISTVLLLVYEHWRLAISSQSKLDEEWLEDYTKEE